jgi:hypothetical protein
VSEETFDPKFDLDLDAQDDAISAEAEAKEVKIKVRIAGRTIEFPPLRDWPYDTQETISDGFLIEAIEDVMERQLGRDGAKELGEFLRKQPGQKIVDIMQHLDRVSGVKTGDFSSSNRASRRNRRR